MDLQTGTIHLGSKRQTIAKGNGQLLLTRMEPSQILIDNGDRKPKKKKNKG